MYVNKVCKVVTPFWVAVKFLFKDEETILAPLTLLAPSSLRPHVPTLPSLTYQISPIRFLTYNQSKQEKCWKPPVSFHWL